MVVYNIVTAICLLLMGGCLVSVIAKIALTYKRQQREERIEYLREYKKGRMALIYICVFPLLLIGFLYEKQPFVDAIASTFSAIVDMVVLKFGPGDVAGLMEASQLYKWAIYISYGLIVLNAGMFAWSIAGQYISNLSKNHRVKMSKDKVIIFGNNSNNRTIYDSEQARKKIIVDKINREQASDLYCKNIVYSSPSDEREYIEKLVARCVKGLEDVCVVINTEDDERNLKLARIFAKEIKNLEGKNNDYIFNLMRVYVFGDPRFETIYEDVEREGLGCITYVNKHQKMATDFVDKYPFSHFMDANHIDYHTSCVKSHVDINAIMIGFGKTNQQIFLTSVAGNQFITKGDNGVEIKKVKYHIFDKSFREDDLCTCKCDVGNKNLNHNYFRYRNECVNIDTDDYLPLPDYPAEEHFHRLDINEQHFYNQLRVVVTRSENDANFIIIAFGSDLENIDMAEKLVTKMKEWGVSNTKIFVKIRRNHSDQGVENSKEYYPICCEDEVVYNIDNIIGDKIFKMSMLRDSVYALEYEVSSSGKELAEEDIERIEQEAHRNWFVKKTPNERESNIYCTLSLRSKLNMMGLDYVDVAEDGEEIDEKAYLEIYAGDDMPDISSYGLTANGKPIIKYTLDFKESRRKDMAIHEHYRWNSFMITKGFVPATKDAIKGEKDEESGKHTNGKSYTLRRHGNLTTFDGLVEFRKMVAERDIQEGETMEQAETRKDVIKYDYQLLDDAHWLLTETGHKIIKRSK